MPHSYFYDKYLQSYDFYCNSMQQRICLAGRRVKQVFIYGNMALFIISYCCVTCCLLSHVFSAGNNLLAVLSPLIIAVCNNPTKYQDERLQAAASLALAKYMLVRWVRASEDTQLWNELSEMC